MNAAVPRIEIADSNGDDVDLHVLRLRGSACDSPVTGWSIYGAQRSQQVATIFEIPHAELSRTSCKRLRSTATARRSEPMVRRGSTVRVRQRALQKSRKTGFSLGVIPWCLRWDAASGAVCGAPKSRTSSGSPSIRSIERNQSDQSGKVPTFGRSDDRAGFASAESISS
jgi:hypothetical protein